MARALTVRRCESNGRRTGSRACLGEAREGMRNGDGHSGCTQCSGVCGYDHDKMREGETYLVEVISARRGSLSKRKGLKASAVCIAVAEINSGVAQSRVCEEPSCRWCRVETASASASAPAAPAAAGPQGCDVDRQAAATTEGVTGVACGLPLWCQRKMQVNGVTVAMGGGRLVEEGSRAFSSSQVVWGAGRHGGGRGDFSWGGVARRDWATTRLVRRLRRGGVQMKREESKSSVAWVLGAGQKVCRCQVVMSP